MNQPCPRCGGSDRFFLVSNPRTTTAPFWLCRRCKHYQPATDADTTGTRTPLRTLSPDEIAQAHTGYTAVAHWCAAHLWASNPESIAALNYLRQRGFSDETIKAAKLGYHPAPHGYAKTGCKALDWGVSSEISHEESHAAQLGGLLGSQGRPKNVLRGTITIPYWHAGVCTLLRGRQFVTSPERQLRYVMPNGETRYVTSPEKPLRYLSPGGVPLYGGSAPTLYLADSIAKADTILLCEGEFKALAAHQSGIAAVAQPGVGYLPDSFVQALAKKTVVICYDVEQRRDPFEFSPGEQYTLSAVGRLCGIDQQQQINRLYQVLDELDKAKSDDIREKNLVLAQQEATKEKITQLKQQQERIKKLQIRVKVVRLPRRADERKVDVDAFLLRYGPDVLRQLIAQAPDGADWHAAHSGGEFGYTRTGMHNGKPIANYKARISETVYLHDGLDITTMHRIALQTPAGQRLSVDVPDEDWADDRKALKSVRVGLREGTFDDMPTHALRAIRILSNQGDPPVDRRVYTCTGWELIDKKWHYLSSDGAVHASGMTPTIRAEIDPEASGNHYALCGPGDPQIGAAAWLSFLRGEVCPQPLALLLAGQAALAISHRFSGNAARSMVWLHHETGSFKTAIIRAGVLALFGPRFTAERADGAPIPKWDATSVGLGLTAFYYRDSALCIDDYKSGMISPEAFRRFLHAYSESTSRTRGTYQIQIEKAKPARALIFSTAEDIPQGDPGMQARLLSLVIKPETVSTEKLSELQRAGSAGHLAAFWRTFLQSIAHELDTHGVLHVQERMQALIRADDADLSGHRRTAGALRQNRAAWLLLWAWLQQAGYITADEARSLNDAHLAARTLLTADLNARQQESRPSQIFLSVLRELISNGELVIEQEEMTCSRCDNPLKRATDGWFCTSPTCNYQLPASRIAGFHCPDGIGLFAQKVFREVSRIRNDQRQPFAYSAPAIWQQLEADGALAQKNTNGRPYVTRRNPAIRGPDGKGKPETVLLIRVNLLDSEILHESGEDSIRSFRSRRSQPETARPDAPNSDYENSILIRSQSIPGHPDSIPEGDDEVGIERIESGSNRFDPKSSASGRDETGWDRKDRQKSMDPLDQRIIPFRPSVTFTQLTHARSLLRAYGTVSEMSTDLASFTPEQLTQFCTQMERRKTVKGGMD
ncbi:MAG: hypothetical protein WCK70_12525 [Chloroflexales bacterium]